MTEIENMKKWFLGLQPGYQLQLTVACRLYSYRFDTYLNSIYRKKMYPRLKLIRHASLLHDEKNHDVWIGILYTTFENRLCNTGAMNGSPFAKFIGHTPILLSEYIKEIERLTEYMHRVFIESNLYYTLISSMIVYRGVIIPKGSELSLYMTGITSVSTDIRNALNFAFAVYQGDDDEAMLYSESEYDSYIIELNLPIDTLVIPMNICTIQEENELIIISQGICEQTPIKTTEHVENWNPYFNLNGDLIKKGKGKLSYTKINATFNLDGSLPEYTKFNISNIMDNVIDDYDYVTL